MKNRIVFDADGWRGLLDQVVNKRNIAYLAQAFANYLITHSPGKDKLKVAVGYDGRNKSNEFAFLFSKVLSANSIYTFLTEKVTATPILSYYVKSKNLDAGVIITGGHSSVEYSGVKFKAGFGGPFLTKDILNLEEFFGTELIQVDDDNILQVDMRSDYYEQLEKIIDLNKIRNANLNILIDSMGGSGQQIIETLLARYNIKCKTIFKIPENKFYGRNPQPVEENLEPLKEELLKNDYSFGSATDGDADGMSVVLENGIWLNPENTAVLLADHVCNNRKISGNIIRTENISGNFDNICTSSKREIISVKDVSGITEYMVQGEAAFGFDESGSYVFKEHIPDRDGILSILMIAEMLAFSGFSKLSDYYQAKKNELKF